MTPELFSWTYNIEIPTPGKWYRINFCEYRSYDAPDTGDIVFVTSVEIVRKRDVILHVIWNEQFYPLLMTYLTADRVPRANYKFALFTDEE